ncbi:MAG: hypothetical protein ABL929_10335, partial [Ferruginibacter sp.]
MLTADELKFIHFWELNRIEYSKFWNKFWRGLPMASIFGLPILLFIGCVYFFLPEWYTKISNTNWQTFVVIFIAIL